jgi:hypothetical protein
MTVLAAADIVDNRWFQALTVFVSFNTIMYAALALAKLWPRKRK